MCNLSEFNKSSLTIDNLMFISNTIWLQTVLLILHHFYNYDYN